MLSTLTILCPQPHPMSQRLPKPLDIAIIGGGPTGLTCAVTLANKGIFANIYEAKASADSIVNASVYCIDYIRHRSMKPGLASA